MTFTNNNYNNNSYNTNNNGNFSNNSNFEKNSKYMTVFKESGIISSSPKLLNSIAFSKYDNSFPTVSSNMSEWDTYTEWLNDYNLFDFENNSTIQTHENSNSMNKRKNSVHYGDKFIDSFIDTQFDYVTVNLELRENSNNCFDNNFERNIANNSRTNATDDTSHNVQDCHSITQQKNLVSNVEKSDIAKDIITQSSNKRVKMTAKKRKTARNSKIAKEQSPKIDKRRKIGKKERELQEKVNKIAEENDALRMRLENFQYRARIIKEVTLNHLKKESASSVEMTTFNLLQDFLDIEFEVEDNDPETGIVLVDEVNEKKQFVTNEIT